MEFKIWCTHGFVRQTSCKPTEVTTTLWIFSSAFGLHQSLGGNSWLLNWYMLHYVHQLVANFDCPLFGGWRQNGRLGNVCLMAHLSLDLFPHSGKS